MYCRKCGSQTIEGTNFCGVCGERIVLPEIQNNDPKPIEKIEIIEVKEEPIESKASLEVILGIILITMVLSVLLISVL